MSKSRANSWRWSRIASTSFLRWYSIQTQSLAQKRLAREASRVREELEASGLYFVSRKEYNPPLLVSEFAPKEGKK